MRTARIGTTLGRYRIERELGSGGIGCVYEAVALEDRPEIPRGRRVALKVVHPHLVLMRPELRRRLVTELEVGKRVRHENVVHAYEGFATECEGLPTFAIAMEFVAGQSLRTVLRAVERVPEARCRDVGRRVAAGLAAIHAAGAVHRDVKPENVLVSAGSDGAQLPGPCIVKISDFGVARVLEEVDRVSVLGSFVGSLDYAAPEQFGVGGRDVDHRVDLYALGLLLYELASGTRPFPVCDIPGLIACTLRQVPPPILNVAPHVSPFFAAVVHVLLRKDPDERFEDAAHVEQILAEGESSRWWRNRTS